MIAIAVSCLTVGLATAKAASVADVTGRTVEVATPVKRVTLSKGRQCEAHFAHMIGWRDDLAKTRIRS